jgi:hypothetical protein
MISKLIRSTSVVPAMLLAVAVVQRGANAAPLASNEASEHHSQAAQTASRDWRVAVDQFAVIATILAADHMDGVDARAKGMAEALQPVPDPQAKDDGAAQLRAIHAAIGSLATPGLTIEAARERFKKLSGLFVSVAESKYVKTDNRPEYAVFYCPMAEASWIQVGDTAVNPYLGAKMLKCGTKESVLGGSGATPVRKALHRHDPGHTWH